MADTSISDIFGWLFGSGAPSADTQGPTLPSGNYSPGAVTDWGNVDWGKAGNWGLNEALPWLAKNGLSYWMNDNTKGSVRDAQNSAKQSEQQQYQNAINAWLMNKQFVDQQNARLDQGRQENQAYYGDAMGMLTPYVQYGQAELPVRQQAYNQSMAALGDAMKYGMGNLLKGRQSLT